MAAIGSLSVYSWRGTVLGEQKPVAIITRAGVAGTGLSVGAYQATPYNIETDYIGTLAQCNTWRDTALGYVGTSQSVTDAFGATWSDTAILGVTFQYLRAIGLGGSNTHIIRAVWHMVSEV
jgi:hypothetical protein